MEFPCAALFLSYKVSFGFLRQALNKNNDSRSLEWHNLIKNILRMWQRLVQELSYSVHELDALLPILCEMLSDSYTRRGEKATKSDSNLKRSESLPTHKIDPIVMETQQVICGIIMSIVDHYYYGVFHNTMVAFRQVTIQTFKEAHEKNTSQDECNIDGMPSVVSEMVKFARDYCSRASLSALDDDESDEGDRRSALQQLISTKQLVGSLLNLLCSDHKGLQNAALTLVLRLFGTVFELNLLLQQVQILFASSSQITYHILCKEAATFRHLVHHSISQDGQLRQMRDMLVYFDSLVQDPRTLLGKKQTGQAFDINMRDQFDFDLGFGPDDYQMKFSDEGTNKGISLGPKGTLRENQSILRHVNLHTSLLALLRILSKELEWQADLEVLNCVRDTCFSFLQGFCNGNLENQHALYNAGALDILLPYLRDAPMAARSLMAMFAGNTKLISTIPVDIIVSLVQQIDLNNPSWTVYFSLVMQLVVVNGMPVVHNQCAVMRVIASNQSYLFYGDGHLTSLDSPDVQALTSGIVDLMWRC